MTPQEVHLATAGRSGTPVLLLHGIGGSSASLRPQLEGLSRHHRVLAWDAPGYGASVDPESAPGITGYVNTVAEVLEEYGPAHLVGVSWGGVIATRLAIDRPGLIRSLTLADSTRGSGVTAEGAARMRTRPAELAERGARAFAESRAPRLLAPAATPVLVEAVVDTMAAVRLPGYAFAAEMMAQTDHSGVLDRVTAATLVIVGDVDRVTGVAESRVLADGVPGARLEIISGAGHAANQERPEEFNGALLDFFDRVDVAALAGDSR